METCIEIRKRQITNMNLFVQDKNAKARKLNS